MPRLVIVNNFAFDAEAFADYMQEQSCLNNRILASGIMVEDPIIEKAVGKSGNVGTVPFFLPVDGEPDALNDDGKTDNKPTALKGSKQTYMAMARMKSWYEETYTRYLTGESPLHNLANNLVIPYWTNQWEAELMAITKGIMGLDAMASHKTDLSVTTGSITDANKIDLTTHLDLGQKALGDKRTQFSLAVMHSQVATNYKKKELIENKKMFSPILNADIEVPMMGSMIVLETDTNTVDTSVEGFPVYHTYMFGRGVFLTCPKQVHRAYGTKYDDEEKGGVEKLYTKQAKVIHPNGFSIKIDNIAEESPTRAELANPANWELKFNHKNIAIAEIISNG